MGDRYPPNAGADATRVAEFALANAYKERTSSSRLFSIAVWEFIRDAVAEKRRRDAIEREQIPVDLPESFRSES